MHGPHHTLGLAELVAYLDNRLALGVRFLSDALGFLAVVYYFFNRVGDFALDIDHVVYQDHFVLAT